MSCADTRPRVRRFRGNGVSGLELWNRTLGDCLFWERVGAPRVDRLRAEGWSEAEVGRDQAGSVALALDDLHQEIGFDSAFVAGGLLEIEGFASALQASGLPCPVRLGPGAFAGEAGGLALLDSLDLPGGIVLDLGQTAIKASSGRARTVRARDPASLPLELIDPAGSRPPPSRKRVDAAAAFVTAAVHDLLARSGPPQPAVVLALPCPLDDDLVPGGCTYGWEGDPSLVPALVDALADALDTKALEVLVLNDAELVAESARLELRPAAGERVLCLTLGFGPGGALLTG
jgi:hypothetical protein